MAKISIVNYGVGNWGSVANMFRRIGHDAIVVSTPEEVERADVLVLPGVGAFDTGMAQLRDKNLIEPIRHAARQRGAPTLGICLGAQLMTRGSEEGSMEGLGLFAGHTRRFQLEHLAGRWPLPNIGWRMVKAENGCGLLEGMEADARFYFVHSFFLAPGNTGDVALTSEYGVPFACGLARDNMFCVQFHPEKSHRFGFRLLENFMKAVKCAKG